ncbi:UNVERIFIED_CONTAM: hypothetical protein Sradi_3627500 [Sesamum radiatum]|uniref:DDE Tnp4 domain-containing protein n=1 Tax=Sesamum radiatum TaxID=300843 RepID=A0AAW2QI67_SESRA
MGDRQTSPQNHEEYFNMKHASARNVIERTFGLLKGRWAILRSPAFYSIKIQNRIIMTCCLLHNYIRQEMPVDPLENNLTESETAGAPDNVEYVGSVDTNQFGTIGEMKLPIACTMLGVPKTNIT